MVRPLIAAVLLTSLIGPVWVLAQGPPTQESFEVASIKRNTSGSGSMTVGVQPGGRFVAVNATPLVLILNAYRHDTFRVIGAPAWMSSERYDVTAVAQGEVNAERLSLLLRALWADRLKLVVHTETRPMPTYALVRARSDGQLGPQLRRWEQDCEALRKAGALSELPAPRSVADFAVAPPCGMRAGPGVYGAGGVSMVNFARSLASSLEIPVTDHTGLNGDYEVTLRWNPDPGGTSADTSLPSLFAALPEQLGLKLEARREPMDVLVIDRIERPSED